MSSRIAQLRNAAAYVANYGIGGFSRELCHRCVNLYYERRLGVETAGRVRLTDIGVSRSDARDSMPIGYAAFFSTFKRVPLTKPDIVFLDFGVGKGRAVCAAATFPLKQVVGVELSKALAVVARFNVERMRCRRTERVDIRHGDATELHVPRDVNLIYFFNPFAGDTLAKVVENIHRSYQEFPRKMYVMFFNNDHFDKIVCDERWIKKIYQKTFLSAYRVRRIRNGFGLN